MDIPRDLVLIGTLADLEESSDTNYRENIKNNVKLSIINLAVVMFISREAKLKIGAGPG